MTLYYNPSSLCGHRGCREVGTYSAFTFTPQGYRWEVVSCEAHRHPSAKLLQREPFATSGWLR